MSISPDLGVPSVVLCIVVYGPASAGKTSTARTLAKGFGQTIHTPEEEDDGTTVYFDWLEYLGGRHEGQPILTQLLTVPGHDRDRRLALLERADVIIFVADTSPDGMAKTVELHQEMLDELHRIGSDPGIVIQANKRDHPSAVSIDDFRLALGLDPDETVIETVASSGEGVRQAFIYAVRNGLDRVKSDPGGSHRRDAVSPDELLEMLQAIPPGIDGPLPERGFSDDTALDNPALGPGIEGSGVDEALLEPPSNRAGDLREPNVTSHRHPSVASLPGDDSLAARPDAGSYEGPERRRENLDPSPEPTWLAADDRVAASDKRAGSADNAVADDAVPTVDAEVAGAVAGVDPSETQQAGGSLGSDSFATQLDQDQGEHQSGIDGTGSGPFVSDSAEGLNDWPRVIDKPPPTGRPTDGARTRPIAQAPPPPGPDSIRLESTTPAPTGNATPARPAAGAERDAEQPGFLARWWRSLVAGD